MSNEWTGLLEEMLNASPDALVVVGPDGRIELATPATEALFGYRPEALVGELVEILLPETLRDIHTRHRGLYATAPEGRPMGVGLQLLARHRDGSVFPVDVSLVPSEKDGRLRVGAFVRDATARRRGEDLLRFVNEISQEVIAGEPVPDLLALTAQRARALVGAAASWISVQSSADDMVVAAADGQAAGFLYGAVIPVASSLAARAMRLGRTFPISDMTAEPDVLPEARSAEFGPGLYLPMQAEGGPVGSLVLARARGVPDFSPAEVAAAEVFASAAAIVLALGSARESLERMKISAEHDRIARDLHDTVIQRLFAMGMRLQAAERLADDPVAERIRATVDSIDEVIREIRETIFDLSRPDTDGGGSNLRSKVRQVVKESTDHLGFAPRLAFRGPVETAVTNPLASQLLSVLREALSNVGRHAKASATDVVLTVADGSVTLSVSDDGVGMPDQPAAGHGLDNMASRARELGGELSLIPRSPSGTLLQWTVPLSAM